MGSSVVCGRNRSESLLARSIPYVKSHIVATEHNQVSLHIVRANRCLEFERSIKLAIYVLKSVRQQSFPDSAVSNNNDHQLMMRLHFKINSGCCIRRNTLHVSTSSD